MRPSALFGLVWLWVGVAGAQSVAGPDTSRTSDDASALSLGHAGLAHFSEGRFSEALDAFSRAEARMHSPVFVLYQARALKELGLLLEARRVYHAGASEDFEGAPPDAWVRARADALREMRELSLLIPRLTLHLEGGMQLPVVAEVQGRQIGIDEITHRLEADPGLHEISFLDARGTRVTILWAARIAERSETLTVRFPSVTSVDEPAPPKPRTDLVWEAPERPPPYGAIAAFSASGAAFVGASVFAAMAYGTARSIKKNCVANSCLPEDLPRAERARRFANLATAGVAVSAVGGVAGIGLLLLDRDDDVSWEVSLSVEAGGLDISGRF